MTEENDLKPFFEPRAVAIVGATRTPGFGYVLPIQLKEQGWGDRTFLVNPRGGELHGFKVYEKVSDLPGEVDLAIMIVGAERAPAAVEEIGARGIRAAIIESAGFAETGGKGGPLQAELSHAAARHNVRLLGPNCVGVVNSNNRFSSVEVVEEALTPGPLGIIAQSGAFGNVLLDGLHRQGLSISKAVTLGNRADVDECEVLHYLGNDPDTRVIIMYIEGAKDGRRLVHTLRKVTPEKPVLVLKSGRTAAGQDATTSHTGSLSGNDQLYDAALAQAGAIRCQTLAEMIDTARIFTTQPLPAGPRLGIITSSGSLGALAADTAINNGLNLPPPSPELVSAIKKDAPSWMNVKNPLDVGPSGLYAASLFELIKDQSFDMTLAITIVPYAVVKRLEQIDFTGKEWFGDIKKVGESEPGKPLVTVVVGAPQFKEHMAGVAGPAVPVFDSPEAATYSLAALWRYSRQRRRVTS